MAHVRKRKGPNGLSYQVRYVDPQHVERSKTFGRKKDADDFAASVTADMSRGVYSDPAAGRITVAEYAFDTWLPSLTLRPYTRKERERILTRCVKLPPPIADGERVPPMALGSYQLRAVLATTARTWQTHLTERWGLAPTTAAMQASIVRSMFHAAAVDRLITWSPFDSVKRLVGSPAEVVPPDVPAVAAMIGGAPALKAAMMQTQATTGARSGELVGITVDRLNLLRRELTIDRQLLTRSQPYTFGPLKSAQVPSRVVPIPRNTVDYLAAYLSEHPPLMSGPWAGIVFHDRGRPVSTTTYWRAVVAAAARADAGVDVDAHSLRHHYATVLIEGGASAVRVQKLLGHASVAVTMRTYAHLFDRGHDVSRDMIEAAWAAVQES